MVDRVLVVGGGVIGLSSAYKLAQAGHGVTLVSPVPGRDGASWVAAGMLAPVTEAQFGEAALAGLLLAGVSLWKDFATSLERDSGLDIGFDQSGTLTVAADPSDRAALDDLLAYQHALGCTAHRRSASQCRALVPSLTPALRGGIDVPGDHQVDNRALLRALVVACRAGRESSSIGRVGPSCLWPRAGGSDRDHVRRRVPRDRLRPVGRRHRHRRHRRGGPRWPASPPPGQGPHRAARRQPTADRPCSCPATVRARWCTAAAPSTWCPADRTALWRWSGPRWRRSERQHLGRRPGPSTNCSMTPAPWSRASTSSSSSRPRPACARPPLTTPTASSGWTELPGVAVATGHYRNGILLAPFTAAAVVDLLGRRPVAVLVQRWRRRGRASCSP